MRKPSTQKMVNFEIEGGIFQHWSFVSKREIVNVKDSSKSQPGGGQKGGSGTGQKEPNVKAGK